MSLFVTPLSVYSTLQSFTSFPESSTAPLRVKLTGRRPKHAENSKIVSHSDARCSRGPSFFFRSRSKAISWIFRLTFFAGVKCHIHVLGVSDSFEMEGDDFPPPPSNIQKRALSTTYRILHKENTHSQTHARIIPPYTPPCVARLCFCLCKITVVQVSSRQSDADRQARKEDSQALVFATKIFLVLQLAVLPSMWLWLQNPSSSSGSRLHLPEEHRGRWKVLSKTSGKVASSFKGPRMYTAHGFLC